MLCQQQVRQAWNVKDNKQLLIGVNLSLVVGLSAFGRAWNIIQKPDHDYSVKFTAKGQEHVV